MRINVHSFIDVITNSSTEIYVQAGENTINTIKELVNILLKETESTKTADDLFTFELIDTGLEEFIDDKLYDYCQDLKEYNKLETYDQKCNFRKELKNKFDNGIDKPDWWDSIEEEYKDKCDYGSYSNIYLDIKPKDENGSLKRASSILSSLQTLFNIEASYDY